MTCALNKVESYKNIKIDSIQKQARDIQDESNEFYEVKRLC